MSTGSQADGEGGFTAAEQGSHVRVRVLGKGAYGTAVLYRHIDDDSLVVVKEFDLTLADGATRQNAIAEGETLAQLHHPNIVTYFDTFEHRDKFMIEMEYADGGCLRDYVGRQGDAPIPEAEVKWLAYQLVSGLQHVHAHSILHRDIKSENIFLTASGLLKLGDFGISKVLTEGATKAASVVGTPYYMAPEVFRGEQYGSSSDMFSAGCVVHELCTLQRTFDGTNLGAIVLKVVKGVFPPLPAGVYSEEMAHFVDRLLDTDPNCRPTADDCLGSALLEPHAIQMHAKVERLYHARLGSFPTSTGLSRRSSSGPGKHSPDSTTPTAVLVQQDSKVYVWGGGLGLKLLPEFGGGNSVMHASIGLSHFAVVTHTRRVFTWNSAAGMSSQDGHSEGQLGHGSTASFRRPKEVEHLQAECIVDAHCGDEFTVFVTEDGRLLACGSNYDGCLGQEEGEEAAEEGLASGNAPLESQMAVPREVLFFSSRPVNQVACGPRHVAAVTADGVYSWGCGEMGRLGLGNEDDAGVPSKVLLPPKADVYRVVCGPDATIFQARQGTLYACGNNEHNKLALDMQEGVLHHRRKSAMLQGCEGGMLAGVVLTSLVPNLVRGLRDKVIAHVSVGATHLACIDSSGRLFCCGNNDHGQLGLGHTKKVSGPARAIGPLADSAVTKVSCGENFTVAATRHQVLAWGSGLHNCLGTGAEDNVLVPRALDVQGCATILTTNESRTLLVADTTLSSERFERRSSVSSCEDGYRAGGSVTGDSSAFTTGEFPSGPVPTWLRGEMEGEFIAAGPLGNVAEDRLPSPTKEAGPGEAAPAPPAAAVGPEPTIGADAQASAMQPRDSPCPAAPAPATEKRASVEGRVFPAAATSASPEEQGAPWLAPAAADEVSDLPNMDAKALRQLAQLQTRRIRELEEQNEMWQARFRRLHGELQGWFANDAAEPDDGKLER